MTPPLHTLKAVTTAELIRNKEITSDEVFLYFAQRSRRFNKQYNAFVSLTQGQTTVNPVTQGRLSGVPIAIKDNICIEGQEVTCASGILKGHIAAYDATVIRRIKRQGLPVIGTTNMDEFAFGSSTETSCYGPTLNPWDRQRVPGGSSGGSAAAVALGCVPLALGSDTGGSIRQPAAFCGVIGMKPTYGRISRYGLVAFGSSLDQIGPLGRSIEDCAALLDIICGHDPLDSTSAEAPVPDFASFLRDDIKDLTIGLPMQYFTEGLSGEVRSTIERVKEVFKDKGVVFKEISLPHTEYAVATYYIIGTAEASSNLSRFEGIRYGARVPADRLADTYQKTRGKGFGREAKRRILLGTYSLSSGYYDAYYLKGLKARTLIQRDFEEAFAHVDAILTPTAPTPAFKLREKLDDPLSMYLSDIYTISANLAGLPALSMNGGFSSAGLPIGFQLMGKQFDEGTLLRLGYSFQKETDWHTRFPNE